MATARVTAGTARMVMVVYIQLQNLLYNHARLGRTSPAMTSLTDYTSYADAQAHWSPAKLWELFDGDRERLNIAHECIDRHVDGEHRPRSSSCTPTAATRS